MANAHHTRRGGDLASDACSQSVGGRGCASSCASQPTPDAIQRRARADNARTAQGWVNPVTPPGSTTMPHQ